MLACLLVAAAVTGVSACGGDSGTGAAAPGSAAAIAAGEAYAAARGTKVSEGTRFLRSTRDPEWALVSGGRADRGVWAVWLRVDGDRWRPAYALLNGRGDSTPAGAPCDIKPPFSEPECAPE